MYHPQDGIIPAATSLYEALGPDSDRDKSTETLLRRWTNLEKVNPLEAGQRYHNYEVASADPVQWRQLFTRVAALLS